MFISPSKYLWVSLFISYFRFAKDSFQNKREGKESGEIFRMPAVAASSVVNAKSALTFTVVGLLYLPVPFTLSFLHPGQHCQLKQSLYLAALVANRVA